MQFMGLAVVLGVLALIILWLGARTLGHGNWFLAWLRGTVGLGLIVLALFAGALAYDLSTYREQLSDKNIAVLSVHTTENGLHQIRLDDGQNRQNFLLDGELWGMDVRVLKWKGVASLIGLQTGYRMDVMNGRYLAIEQQNAALYPEAQLSPSWLGIDLWRWLQNIGGSLPFVSAEMARVSYIPLENEARYGLEWLPTGLQVRPMNSVAELALQNWVE